MNTPFPPPPAPAAAPKRRLWPWFLGGCLTLLLIGGLAIGGMVWFGMKQVGTQAQSLVQGLPGVQEHFGAVTDAGMDFAAMGTTPGAMVFKITGEKGEGRLTLQLDPATHQFRSASLTLPSGEVRELSADDVKALQALSQGAFPPSG